jgi:DNA repair exonuclease SbcCD ATPase subunit
MPAHSETTNGVRTHEPSLREVTTELDGVKELLLSELASIRNLVDERDRLYKERNDAQRTAVDAALTAVKEQTKASFEASEKAIVKAEEAQKSYNQSHNDLARKMDDQNKATVPRPEAESRFRTLEDKITDLRESRSEHLGATVKGRDNSDLAKWVIGLIVTVVLGTIAIVVSNFVHH